MSNAQLAWNAMKQRECFTVTEIANTANMDVENCRHLVKRLLKKGFIEIKNGIGVQGSPYVYAVKASNDSPTFGRGGHPGREIKQSGRTGHQLIWNALRINLTVTPKLAQAVTNCSLTSIRRYLLALERTGYVRCHRIDNRQAPADKIGQEHCYRLIRSTGPKAPILRIKPAGVYDQNNRQFYAYSEAK